VIVGGGIGGLSAAIALRQAGHDVIVLERAERLDPIGAGISLFGNAMRGLGRLGVRDAVAERGAPATYSAALTSAGRVLSEIPRDLIEGAVAVHRGDLQAVLADAAGGVRLGAEVTSVEQDDGVAARLADGSEERGDLLVGADGLASLVRTTFSRATPRYAGYTAWRGVAPVAVAAGRWTESWGTGARFGLLDIGGGRTYWFATKNAPEGEGDEPGGRKAEILARFSKWHDPIAHVVEATSEEAILRNDVYDLEPFSPWHSGRVVLLGDAAHATTPGIGQGAAQAIEDAVVLAECLMEDDLATTLARYEERRIPRTARVLKLSRQADRMGQLDKPLASLVRNMLVRMAPASAQQRQLGPIVNGEP
jgi:2-polyprenyl-6-methoxyphenol hydroxylase-like FAD-dependent oxidoreductase